MEKFPLCQVTFLPLRLVVVQMPYTLLALYITTVVSKEIACRSIFNLLSEFPGPGPRMFYFLARQHAFACLFTQPPTLTQPTPSNNSTTLRAVNFCPGHYSHFFSNQPLTAGNVAEQILVHFSRCSFTSPCRSPVQFLG